MHVSTMFCFRKTATNFINSYLSQFQDARIDSFWIGATGKNYFLRKSFVKDRRKLWFMAGHSKIAFCFSMHYFPESNKIISMICLSVWECLYISKYL